MFQYQIPELSLSEQHRQLFKNIRTYDPVKIKSEQTKNSAVIIPIFCPGDNDLSVVLTKRSNAINSYKGHICFPGGRKSDSDQSLFHTVLRETKEELGIPPEKIFIFGELDDFYANNGSVITPYVAFLGIENSHEFNSNIDEVSAVYVEKIKKFFDPKIELNSKKGKRSPMYIYNLRDIEIWGLTSAIMTRFIDIGFGITPERPISKLPFESIKLHI